MSYGAIDDGAVIAQIQHSEDALQLVRLRMAENRNESGRCRDCGANIPAARLKAVPNAARCLPCQAEWDEESRFTYRNPYIP